MPNTLTAAVSILVLVGAAPQGNPPPPPACSGCVPDSPNGAQAAGAEGVGYVRLAWAGTPGECEVLWRRVIDNEGEVTFIEECHEGDQDFCDLVVVRQTGNVDQGSVTYARKSPETGNVWDISQNFPQNGTTGTAVPQGEEINCGSERTFRLAATVHGVPIEAELSIECSGCGE